MPDDDWALGQNEVDVRNEARREYQRHDVYGRPGSHACDPSLDWVPDEQTALCTNDERCQAAADEHDPGCPVEQQLVEELGF